MTPFCNQKHHKNNATVIMTILPIEHHFYEIVHEGKKGGTNYNVADYTIHWLMNYNASLRTSVPRFL